MDLPEASKEVVQVFAARGRLFSQPPQLSWVASVIEFWHGKGHLVVFVFGAVWQSGAAHAGTQNKAGTSALQESSAIFEVGSHCAAPAVGGICGLSCAQEVSFWEAQAA